MTNIIVHYEVSRFRFTLGKIPAKLTRRWLSNHFPHKSNERQNFILASKADDAVPAHSDSCYFKKM
jgi:hypothetical protein